MEKQHVLGLDIADLLQYFCTTVLFFLFIIGK